jgi:phosphatidylserine/phosphatidylglycerophosphate/cardiolipin synthase-like enzyme
MKQYAEAEAKAKSFEDVTAHIDSILGDASSINPYKNLLKKTSGNRELSRKIIAYIFSKAAGHPELYTWAEELVQATQQALFEPRKIVHEPMFFPSIESEAKVVHYLNSATTTLDICVFSITYNVLGDAIIEAHKRGVKVRVISDDEQAKNPGADIERLQAAGVPLKIDLDPKAHMHNKFVLIDKQVLLTGSFNWTKQAALKNNENFMATNDEYLIEKYGEEYERLWEKFIVPGTAVPHPPRVAEPSASQAVEKPADKAAEEPEPGDGEPDPDEMLSG